MSDLPTIARVALEVGASIESLSPVLASPEAFDQFVRDELGIDAPQALAALGLDAPVLQAVTDSIEALGEALDDDAPDDHEVEIRALAAAGAVTAAVAHVVAAARRSAEGQDPAFVAATNLAEELPRRLADWLVIDQLEERSLVGLDALQALAVAEVEPVAPDPSTFTTEHVRRAVHLDVLAALVTDPQRWCEEAYGWGGPDSRMETLLRRLFNLGMGLGLPVELGGADLQRVEVLGSAPLDAENMETPLALRMPLWRSRQGAVEGEVGLGLVVLPANGTGAEGLALTPFVTGAAGVDIPLDLAGEWVLSLAGLVGAEGGLGLVARPGAPLRALADIDGTGTSAAGRLEIAVRRTTEADERMLVGFGSGSGLFLNGASLKAAALFEQGEEPELVAELAVQRARLRIAVGESDGFVRSVLPAQLDVTFDAGLGISTRRGVYLVGGAGLEVSHAVGQRIAAVTVERLTTRVRARTGEGAAGLTVEAEAVVSLALGPFSAAVAGIGARLQLDQADGGNLGPLDADVGFKPPTGLGLAISTPEIAGGGFLRFDPDAGRYSGVFELTLLDTISVKAVAIVTTKLPDGRPGFALLLLITADGFTPIPLGLGFTLTGIGGLVALNRTIDVEAVRRGLSSGLLDSVLFAKDPVANADGLLATLEQVFPLARDRLLIGPLAEISWGSPPVVKVRLALLLEVPQPLRAVLLAALAVVLPDPERAVVELHVDAIGVLDLGRGELALDASLHHSRLWKFGLTGDLALRLNWGDNPTFLMSVGGFHPRFTPPAGLRRLERITFSLSGSDNPRIRFESYLAVTSNTIQLGARVTLRAQKGGFGVDGGGAFDALVQWSPFGLAVDFEAWVKVFSPVGTLFAARLKVAVTGPQPWHVKGTITFDVLWWSVSAGVDFTIGEPLPPAPLDTVDVAALLWDELSRPQSWSTTLPPGVAPGVTLVGGESADLLVHPLGTVSVRQKVVPLGTRVTRMGAQRPRAGARSYDLDVDGPAGVTAQALADQFALAQYTELTEDQKLAAPSFTRLPAGLSFGPAAGHAVPADRSVTTDLLFETLDLTDLDLPATPGAPPAPAPTGLLDTERAATADRDLASLKVVPA